MTSGHHRVVRLHLALLPLYVWSLYIWPVSVQQLPVARFAATAVVFRDFAHFYVLGGIARDEELDALYSVPAQQARVERVVPSAVDTVFPPSYGPQVALMFAPFARLAYVPALLAWLGVTTALYGLVGWTLWRVSPNLRSRKWALSVLLASAPAFHYLLMYGQTSAVALVCFVAAYVAFRHEHLFWAGVAIGGLFYKPQLGLAAAVLCVGALQWRVVAGAMVMIAFQLGVALAFWGAAALRLYWAALLRLPGGLGGIEPTKQHMHSWRAFFQLLGLADSAVLIATTVASAATLIVALSGWRRLGGDLRLRFALLLMATALVNPHMYVYDLVVLTPAGVLLWDYIADKGGRPTAVTAAIASILILVFAAPLLELVAVQARIQPSVVALAAGTVLLANLLRLDGSLEV